MRRSTVTILAVLWALAIHSASAQPETEDEPPPLSTSEIRATISVSPQGDVIFYSSGSSLAFAGIVHRVLGCEIKSYGKEVEFDVCHHMLAGNGVFAEGTLRLAPLVTALREAGAKTVILNEYSAGDAPETTPPGWTRHGRLGYGCTFTSRSDTELPTPLLVVVGHRAQPGRIVTPLIAVLLVPIFVALWLNFRASDAAIVWLNWLILGVILYWISAADLSAMADCAGYFHLQAIAATLFSAVLFSGVPLLAIALCLSILSKRMIAEGRTPARVGRLIRRVLVDQAVMLVPLGFVLTGARSIRGNATSVSMVFGSMLVAYVAYKALTRMRMRWNFCQVHALESGELLDRINALAAKAGVKLNGAFVLRTTLPEEANAYATSSKTVIITESLLNRLTKREVDAVMGHEIGHLQGSHPGVQSAMLWIFILVVAPFLTRFMIQAGVPVWVMHLPIVTLLATITLAFVSRRHEFSADAKAAELTGDPEAKMAALARIARITRSPLHWGGIQGSILSHPSMRNRLLALARRCGVSDARALSILENPDVIGGESYNIARLAAAIENVPDAIPQPAPGSYHLPAGMADREPMFSSAAKISFLQTLGWLWDASLVLLSFSAAALVAKSFDFWERRPLCVRIFLLCQPLIFVLLFPIARGWEDRFMKKMERSIRLSRNPPPSATFVSLLPGDRVLSVEGFTDWDLGYFDLTAGSLSYTGERTRFSLAQSGIRSVELLRGPLSWQRSFRVLIRAETGSFSFQLPGFGASKRSCRRLIARLRAWSNEPGASNQAIQLPPLSLPLLRENVYPRLRLCWHAARKIVELHVISLILAATLRTQPLFSLAAFTVPFLYLVRILPELIRHKPKSTQAPAPIPEPAAVETEAVVARQD